MEELIKRLRELHPEEFGDAWDFAFACQRAMHEAADAIEELQAQLMYSNDAAKAIAEKVPKWIPVTERLPICGDTVICFGDSEIEIADFVMGDKWSALPWFFTDGEQETGVTHWMPLPKPPKEET